MILIYTQAVISLGGGVVCPECDAEITVGHYEEIISSYEDKKEINNLLDEQKIEACLEGMGNKSLEQIENFFKSK